MATKRQVEARCSELGVQFDYDPQNTIGIEAPVGFHFVADAYGWHYADFPPDRPADYPRHHIYDCLLECMAEGIEACEPGCECGWDDTDTV